MSHSPMMTPEEVAFLGRCIRPQDRVWEYGGGASSLWLAERCRHLTTVEHDPLYAATLCLNVRMLGVRNLSVIFIPPDQFYQQDTEEDGTLDQFRSYIESYIGRSIDVVLLDGRARVAAAQYVAERAPFGPNRDTRVLLHDCDREAYRPICDTYFREVERVGNLMLLAPRLGDFVARPTGETDEAREASGAALAAALKEAMGAR